MTLFLAAGENGRLVGAKERVDAHDETEGGVQHARRGLTPLLADALVGLTYEQKREITSESAIALYGPLLTTSG